ncbi:MAG TPA: hypothetical protein VLG92_01665 [Candidatus Saccharimonadia bacterium]|nr:hypothetical protein [Candidatus Saccharimonadia bacterium]
MKNNDIHLNINDIPAQLAGLTRKANAYRAFLFFLLVASLYGFIIWRINVSNNTSASASEETAQTVAQPHIDAATIQKIQNLQDNSVRVQSLFDNARQNPFHE